MNAMKRILVAGGTLVLGSAVVSAYANVLNKKSLSKVPPVLNVWGQTLVGSIFLFLGALTLLRPVFALRCGIFTLVEKLALAFPERIGKARGAPGRFLARLASFKLGRRAVAANRATTPLFDTMYSESPAAKATSRSCSKSTRQIACCIS